MTKILLVGVVWGRLSTLLHCPSISPALMTLLDNMWGLLGVSEGDEEGGDAVPMAGLMGKW